MQVVAGVFSSARQPLTPPVEVRALRGLLYLVRHAPWPCVHGMELCQDVPGTVANGPVCIVCCSLEKAECCAAHMVLATRSIDRPALMCASLYAVPPLAQTYLVACRRSLPPTVTPSARVTRCSRQWVRGQRNLTTALPPSCTRYAFKLQSNSKQKVH